MHHGRILDTGTLSELRDRHQEHDFEELFFSLLSRHEGQATEAGIAVAEHQAISTAESMPKGRATGVGKS